MSSGLLRDWTVRFCAGFTSGLHQFCNMAIVRSHVQLLWSSLLTFLSFSSVLIAVQSPLACLCLARLSLNFYTLPCLFARVCEAIVNRTLFYNYTLYTTGPKGIEVQARDPGREPIMGAIYSYGICDRTYPGVPSYVILLLSHLKSLSLQTQCNF